MNYDIETTEHFEKKAVKLLQKYPSLINDFVKLYSQLKENPFSGNSLGKGLYKVRFSIESKRKGKSGGGRVITFIAKIEKKVYLLEVYSKGVKNTVSDDEIKKLLNQLKEHKSKKRKL